MLEVIACFVGIFVLPLVVGYVYGKDGVDPEKNREYYK